MPLASLRRNFPGKLSWLAGALLLTFLSGQPGIAGAQAARSSQLPHKNHGWYRTSIIGVDERRKAGDGETDLLRAVGIVVCLAASEAGRHSARATATLVGSRQTVLTAAHVFTDDTGPAESVFRFDAVRDCRFQQFDTAGEQIAETGFSDVAYGDFRRNAGLPTEDWAVLRTSEPMAEPSRPLPYARLEFADIDYQSRLPIAAVAFHADLRARRRTAFLSVGEVFAVDYAGFRRLAHTADMGRMSSGAALVHRTADGSSVVLGVHRSTANFGDYNLAVPIAGALEATLNGFALGRAPEPGVRMASAVPDGFRFLSSRRWTGAR